MDSIQKRAKQIEQDILAHANQEKEKYLEEAKEYKRQELERTENEVLGESHEKIQDAVADLKTQTARAIAQKENDVKRELYIHRQQLGDQVFDAVKEKLRAYTKTPAYEEKLLKMVKELGETYPKTGCELHFAACDEKRLSKLEQAFGHPCAAKVDANILLGGVILINSERGIYVDQTLDGKLEEQRDWFYQNSGLSID